MKLLPIATLVIAGAALAACGTTRDNRYNETAFADTSAPADSPARYGDTKTQAISVLKAIETRLKEHGLGMKDVVYLRAYLVADKNKGNVIDTQGWNDAYGQFFNNTTNPVKTARSTVGVAALVNPAWLVEIEAFAVFPPQ